jgi:hypothetical protein
VVFNIPLRRLLALVELAEKRLAREQAQFMIGVRASVWADAKVFQKLMKELEGG